MVYSSKLVALNKIQMTTNPSFSNPNHSILNHSISNHSISNHSGDLLVHRRITSVYSLFACYLLACLCTVLVAVGCKPPEEMTPTNAAPRVSAASTTAVEQDSSTSTSAGTTTSEPNVSDISVSLASYDDLLSKVAEFKGKVVVVDIWSTSCVPCMREFPHLVELAKMHTEDVRCISMNVDYIGLKNKPAEKYLAKVEDFLREQSANITNFLSSDPDEIILEKFEVGAMPAILIFDQSGDLVIRLTDSNSGEDGLTYEGDVVPAIQNLLSNK